uniref:Uncharacterized protein n=1 Tax=Rhizophora mucronata TaxID=61149 RepID=A0A2P2PYB6_RHIMU
MSRVSRKKAAPFTLQVHCQSTLTDGFNPSRFISCNISSISEKKSFPCSREFARARYTVPAEF